MKNCPQCGKQCLDYAIRCPKCKTDISNVLTYEQAEFEKQRQIQQWNSMTHQQQQIALQTQQIQVQQQAIQLQQQQFNAMARCPKCGSTSLSGNKKGYGVGKGVVGMAIAGPIGLVAGNLNAKKVYVTCLNCGYRYKK